MRERFLDKALFGAYIRTEDGTESFAGFVGKHAEGSVGMLTVLPEFRGQKIALALETYMINKELEQGFTPYGQVREDNAASIKLQQKVGLCFSKTPIFWVC
ncbi:MAG: GNAT family N-acetyltransferase [Agathobacter sp.]|nr:GNAT family N-acetyltransferase [Agathobacter sp.]